MRLGNPSELGPWNRFEDHSDANQYTQTKNSTFIPQIVLPKVGKPRHHLLKVRRSKERFYEPLRMKPIQIQIKNKKHDHPSSQLQISEGRQSQTLEFDIPKIFTHGRSFQKYNKTKQKANFFQETNKFNQQHNKWSISPKMSKIDLMAQYINEKQGQKSIKINQNREYEFSKKRSLMQMLRYLRFSPQASMSERKGIMHKIQKLGRYEGYLNMGNLSPKGQSNYLPNFSMRKANNNGRKK